MRRAGYLYERARHGRPPTREEGSPSMEHRLAAFFGFERAGTNLRREVLGGVTTFVTMAYIVAVNPAILKAAGIPEGPSMVATVMTAMFGTLVMGLYANRPFAIAPYMGENAFVAFTVVRVLGFRWQTALGAVFIAGVLFTLLTAARVRQWMMEAVPPGLRFSFAAGIGLFLAFIGLNEAGIVTLGIAGAPVRIGALNSAPAMVAIFGFVAIAMLTLWRVPGAILIGILMASAAAFAFGVASMPHRWVSAPPSPAPILFKLDFRAAFGWGFFGVLLTIFVMALVDTLGTLVGVAERAGLIDEHGHLPQIERPMMADALATTFAALVGTTTAGAYVESAAGVSVGGRTGMTAVVTAALFGVSLFFAPTVTAIPPQAYGPALVIVGAMMIAPIRRIDFDDYTELMPAFAIIALMSFTYNIGVGVTAGFVLYPWFKVAAGRGRDIRPGLWALNILSTLFFVFYPY
jgi:AGZA family xanthine/uracil permease-like MFS transporter